MSPPTEPTASAASTRPDGRPRAAAADPTVGEQVLGGLLGLAAGDALGATCEFSPPRTARADFHTEITGGGAFGWRPGQGTDDSDLTVAVARAYAGGYSLPAVAAGFLGWRAGGPRDIGSTTRAALEDLARRGDPHTSGQAALAGLGAARTASNGSLMRCLPTGLARPHRWSRHAETRAISAITHAEPRCLAACQAYNDLVAALLAGHSAARAVELVALDPRTDRRVAQVLAGAARQRLATLDTSGYVLATLEVAVWALLAPEPLEDLLIGIVNRGGDADTTAAVAGGLLGVRDGAAAVPARWLRRLEYRQELTDLADTDGAATRRPSPAAPATSTSSAVSAAGSGSDRRRGSRSAARRAATNAPDRRWSLILVGDQQRPVAPPTPTPASTLPRAGRARRTQPTWDGDIDAPIDLVPVARTCPAQQPGSRPPAVAAAPTLTATTRPGRPDTDAPIGWTLTPRALLVLAHRPRGA